MCKEVFQQEAYYYCCPGCSVKHAMEHTNDWTDHRVFFGSLMIPASCDADDDPGVNIVEDDCEDYHKLRSS